jgi:ABC-type glycerol-3-phosphate transport system substrate-binding protein
MEKLDRIDRMAAPSRGFMDKSRSTPPWRLCLFSAVLLFVGCPSTPHTGTENGGADQANAPAAVAIRVTVVDDPHLLQAIEREWRSQTEDDIALRPISEAELLAAKRLSTDVLVLPAELLGELVEAGRIQPIPDATLTDVELARDTFFPRLRSEAMMWGKTTYAVPLGAPTFQLLYRADIFEKLELSPPTTWADYQELLAKLANREAIGDLGPADEAAWSPSVEPLAPGWAHKVLLARAASAATQEPNLSPWLDLASLEPRIVEPAYQHALETLAAAAKDHPAWLKLTPESARAELLAGRSAMAITWPSGVREEGVSTAPKAAPIRIAALPQSDGQAAYLGTAGYVAAVVKDCRRPSVALKFLTWLTGPESSARISSQAWAGSPTRDTQASQAGQWLDASLPESLGGEYFTLLQSDQTRSRFLPALRLPKRAPLQAALDEAVTSAVTGKKTPDTALATASRQWQQILREMDAEEFRAQARRSLNLSQ